MFYIYIYIYIYIYGAVGTKVAWKLLPGRESKRNGDAVGARGFPFSMTESRHFEPPNLLRSVSNFEREFNSSRWASLRSRIPNPMAGFSDFGRLIYSQIFLGEKFVDVVKQWIYLSLWWLVEVLYGFCWWIREYLDWF